MKNVQDINIYTASVNKLCTANRRNRWNVRHNAYLKIHVKIGFTTIDGDFTEW